MLRSQAQLGLDYIEGSKKASMNDVSFGRKKKAVTSVMFSVLILFIYLFFGLHTTIWRKEPFLLHTLSPNFPDHTLDFFCLLLRVFSLFSSSASPLLPFL